jgi:diguanylate cyclase (GGDEF)-like protein
VEATILNIDVTSVMTDTWGVRPYNLSVDFRPSEHPKKCLIVALALVSAQIALSLFLPRSFALTAFGDITQCLLLSAALLAIFSNVPASRGWTRFFWSLLSLGVGMWLSAQVLWTYFEVFRRQDVPDPFVGDIVFFLHIVPLMAALAVQPHTQRDDHSVRFNLLDFLLLLVWWLYLYLFAVVSWQYVYQNDEAYGRSFNVSYLAEHLAFLCVLALSWRRSVGGWKIIYQQLFGAASLYAIGSVEASIAIDRHIYYTGSLFDVPLVASMAWFTYIGLRARKLAKDAQFRKSPAARPGIWTGRLAMLTVFSTPLMVAWALFWGHAPDSVRKYRVLLTIGTMLAMGFLVFLKQRLLDRDLMQLLEESNQTLENVRELKDDLVKKESLLRTQSLELQRKNLELQEASYTDAMTGLWNRRYLEETLAAESGNVLRSYQRAEHDGRSPSKNAIEHRDLVFIMVDIDWFKRVNDDHGHTVGDTLLRAVAKRLSRIMRKSDVLIRWGGEEFMILTRSSDRSEITTFCTRILEAIGSVAFDLGGGIEVHKTCSIGWAPYPWSQSAYEAICAEEVIELADTALYLAKAMGRNQGAGFVPSDQAMAAPKRVTIENLRQKNSDLIKVISTAGAGKNDSAITHEDVGIKAK